ncbi:MAG: hypothetical protein D6790_21960, partial [Caldilineae bacterium]
DASRQEMVVDLREKGRGGATYDKRLFMQLLAFGECTDVYGLAEALEEAGFEAALYVDINDPQGVGLLTMHTDPDFFVTALRSFLNRPPFVALKPKPEYTMLGRTYAIGYEADLEDTLIGRPKRRALDPAWPWVIWYPLRRVKGFELLPEEEQARILGEHGAIGRAFGKADLATDIRLACHGLDKHDNDFVVAVLGHELHPCSAVVQRMRKTQQTSRWLESLGPFFIGKAVWQAKPKSL